MVLEELGEGIVGELEGFKVKKIVGVGDLFDSGTWDLLEGHNRKYLLLGHTIDRNPHRCCAKG